VIGTDPAAAPVRTDLPYLRRRTRRAAAAVPAAPAAGRTASAAPAAGALSDFMTGHATGHPHDQRSSAVDVRPTASLDLGEPALAPSLDLSAPVSPAPAPAPLSLAGPATPKRRNRVDRQVRSGTQTILTVATPTVTLSRIQSGVGTLTITAACSAEVGDLRLGAAFQLRSGPTSTVQSSGGNRFAPAGSRRPVIVGGRETYERLSVDLRQCRDLERLAVFAFSESRSPLQWGGTLVVSTFGGADAEVPLEAAQGEVIVLATLYNVAGEFVLRAEMQPILGDVREACRAYGYDRITWLDGRNPVD
jgi:uncharacterized protein involved in tellurium resistance